MRSTFAVLAVFAAAASPAAAQVCDCGGYAEPGPAAVLVPHTRYVPRTRYSAETVLVPRTRYERRVVLVPRTRLVPRTVEVSRTEYLPRTTYTVQPAYGDRYRYADRAAGYGRYGDGYPVGYHYGATYVPPGAAYGCRLGTLGCDAGAVGALDD